MIDFSELPDPRWADAAAAAVLLAVDPIGTGGVSLRSRPGPVRDLWLSLLREALPADAPWRRVPAHVGDDRLIGGLDLAASLRAGRPVLQRGLLAEADGGVVEVAMAERMEDGLAARFAAALDARSVDLQRDGLVDRYPARWAVVALDEGIEPEECPPAVLLDRLAFRVDLTAVPLGEAVLAASMDRLADAVHEARARLSETREDPRSVEVLCSAAWALGIGSLRAPTLALRVARAAAALAGRDTVCEDDAALAARLVLAPRACALPGSEAEPEPAEPEASDPQPEPEAADPPEAEASAADPDEARDADALEAARAVLPPGLLERIALRRAGERSSPRTGRAGVKRTAARRGRRVGVRPGHPSEGVRLDLAETLRAAAPWQRLRRSDRAPASTRIAVHRDDFRVPRTRERTETTVIFAVDASGSTALQRLAEAKGAVELLLADCHARRDQVALIGFRGARADLLLPPTRSLVRVRRSLAALPGGGGTPLASGIDAAAELAASARRAGRTPLVVFLTDGRANVARDGRPDRSRAEGDAWTAARQLRCDAVGSLVVDTSPRRQANAERLAQEMGAGYLPLPHADASALCRAVLDTGAARSSGAARSDGAARSSGAARSDGTA